MICGRWLPLALAVLALAVAPPVAATPVDHLHSSSRYDRSAASLSAQLARFGRTRTQLVTLTEVDGRERALVVRRAARFHAYRAVGSDLAVLWRPRGWLRHRAVTSRLTGSQRAAWVVLTRRSDGLRVLVTLAHLPSHVELGDRWRSGSRADTWRAAVARWSQQLDGARRRWRPELVLVVADWNVDLRRPVWRRVVTDAFHGLRLSWRREQLPHGGTHAGRRIIDGTLTDGAGAARLARDDSSSDHRPYRERLSARQ